MCANRFRCFLQFVCCLAILLPVQTLAQALVKPDILKILSHELRPYHWQSATGNLLGPPVTTLTCALSQLEQAHEIKVVPLSQAQLLVAAGTYDAFFIASQNAKRDQYATFSKPFYFDEWLFVYHPENVYSAIAENEAGKPDRIGVLRGSNMAHWAARKGFHNRLESNSFEQLFTLLSLKRLDAVMVTSGIFEEYQAQALSEPSSPQFIAEQIRKLEMGIYFGHSFLQRFPDYSQQFNRAVGQCMPGLS